MKAIAKSLLALGLAAGIVSGSMHEASADRGWRGGGGGVAAGVAAGIIGLGILGAYSSRAHAYPACYDREQCGYAGRTCWENRYGETVCRGGEYRCWMRRVCR